MSAPASQVAPRSWEKWMPMTRSLCMSALVSQLLPDPEKNIYDQVILCVSTCITGKHSWQGHCVSTCITHLWPGHCVSAPVPQGKQTPMTRSLCVICITHLLPGHSVCQHLYHIPMTWSLCVSAHVPQGKQTPMTRSLCVSAPVSQGK